MEADLGFRPGSLGPTHEPFRLDRAAESLKRPSLTLTYPPTVLTRQEAWEVGELPVTQGLAPHHGCSQLCAPVARGEPTGRWEKVGSAFPACSGPCRLEDALP